MPSMLRFQTLLVLLAACPILVAQPVATLAGRAIERAQLQVFRDSHPGLRAEDAIQALVRREVAWEHARRAGLTRDASWEAFAREARRRALVKAYLESQPGHTPPSEEQAKAIYLKQGEERQVWHLLAAEKDKAEAALKRLKKGEDPGGLAAELSTDPAAKRNRGDLGWIRKEQVVPAFGEAAFGAAVGGLAGPVKTEYGWHVLKVLGTRKPTLEGWTREGAAFRAGIAETYLGLKRESALKDLRTRFPLEKRADVLGQDRTTVAAAGDERRVAGRVAGRSLSLRELKRYIQETLRTMGSSHSLGAEMKGRLMEGMADEIRLEVAGRAAGLERKPAFLSYVWDMERETALERYTAWHLQHAKIADAELEAHRGRHSDRFRGPGGLRVQLLAFDNLGAAQAALREAAAGAAWADLFRRHADRNATGNWDAGWLEVAALRTTLADADLQRLLQGELNVPIGPLQGPDGPMLFKVLERKPGPLLPLAKCRKAVREDLLKASGPSRLLAFLDGEGRRGLSIQVHATR